MQRAPITKYRPYPTVQLPDRQWPNRVIDRAPIWCSVDLRDGNQALPIPMSVAEKLEYFDLLLRIGFKEIEIGFPSASDTEFRFARRLVEENRIPPDVAVQVLVQCREALLRRSFEAIDGAPTAIIHFYNSTNPLQRRVTFNMSKAQIKQIAVDAAKLCRDLESTVKGGTKIRYQYSPESFSDTELEYSLEVCEAVLDVIQPTPDNPLILNLPDTVQYATPNVHADQIEWFIRHLSRRDSVIISLHTHNDRGTGVAATELGLMAGADRVEGTLFGNGERTGNLDIVTVALNMYNHGVDPKLDFGDLPEIRSVYERVTRMSVHDRAPYAGDLAYTAFSGSHQDAIRKGMAARAQEIEEAPHVQGQSADDSILWQVPYLPLDPHDIGRSYQAIIRINSQSGKGGVAYVLERAFGIEMPKLMHPEFGLVATTLADREASELTADQIKDAFYQEYTGRTSPLELVEYDLRRSNGSYHKMELDVKVRWKGKDYALKGAGNGPISAFVNALDEAGWKNFKLMDYSQKALTKGSAAEAASFICLQREDGQLFWGASIEVNVEYGGMQALVSAFNRAHSDDAIVLDTTSGAQQ
ncbi:MAG: 2-isopropylmalate synthase [Verrucomicrobiota bacterium JB022]|nr:2-isopropylmalate synthase [Verrucomicrobiota bacterium JB022]